MNDQAALQPAPVTALQDPAAWPWPAERVERIETHISVVLLAGDHVLKIKKPVDFGFLDVGTLERRKRFCVEEPVIALDTTRITDIPPDFLRDA